MGRATSKGNETKRKTKQPSDMPTSGFDHGWQWSVVQHATARPRRRPRLAIRQYHTQDCNVPGRHVFKQDLTTKLTDCIKNIDHHKRVQNLKLLYGNIRWVGYIPVGEKKHYINEKVALITRQGMSSTISTVFIF